MKTMRPFYAVVAGIAALGVVLAAVGFALSGFNPHVFESVVERDQVILGGTTVLQVEDVPLLSLFS